MQYETPVLYFLLIDLSTVTHMLCWTTRHPNAAQPTPKHVLMSTGTSQHDLLYQSCPNAWQHLKLLLSVPLSDFFCLVCTWFKGHLLACHPEICRGSSPNGHLGKSDSASRQFFKVSFSACLRPLADRAFTAPLLVSREGSGPQHIPPCNVYYSPSEVFMWRDTSRRSSGDHRTT